jgi:hypothetical protein
MSIAAGISLFLFNRGKILPTTALLSRLLVGALFFGFVYLLGWFATAPNRREFAAIVGLVSGLRTERRRQAA